MASDELAGMNATAIAYCIDVGELDPDSVIEFTLAQIDNLYRRVNVVVATDGDQRPVCAAKWAAKWTD